MSSVQVIAQQADPIFEEIMKLEPTAAMVMSMLMPGVAPVIALVQPEILMLAPAIDAAIHKLMKGDNVGAFQAIMQLIMHLTQGMPDSPKLSQAN